MFYGNNGRSYCFTEMKIGELHEVILDDLINIQL
jgi:hypothetical protein